VTASAAAPGLAAPRFALGRPFVGPAFDLLVIGGGLTLPLLAWIALAGGSAAAVLAAQAPLLALAFNQAHFAASTVRLYTKPGAFRELPFQTLVLPALTIGALALCVAFPEALGRHLLALYLTWSPYHYAAQTFGLAAMYCARSGCALSQGERRLLRLACLAPFAKAFLSGATAGYGIGWLLPASALTSHPLVFHAYTAADRAASALTFALPLLLFWRVARGSRALPGAPAGAAAAARAGAGPRPAMPWIALVLMLSNGIWWVVLPFLDAFLWATVLHGLQYLAIVSVFHVAERRRAPWARLRSPALQVAALYAACLALGYALFQCWPLAWVWAGFGMVESVLLVVSIVNIHHFVVDAAIWRLRRDAGVRTVVAAGAG
jgi:hypothetical protein